MGRGGAFYGSICTGALSALAVLLVILVFCTDHALAEEQSSRPILVLSASEQGVGYTIGVQAEGSEDGGRRTFRLWVTGSPSTDRMTGYEGEHNRHADYYYQGREGESLTINGETRGSPCAIIVEPDGMYRISAAAVFVWKTSTGKAAAGFPPYHRTRIVSEPVDLSGKELINGGLRKSDSGGDEPPFRLTVRGHVGHTRLWEKNRAAHNANVIERYHRDQDEFWPGEKLMLTAYLNTGGRGSRVTAEVRGSRTECVLRREGELWKGAWFDEGFWERRIRDPWKELVIRFRAEHDGLAAEDIVRIKINDEMDYYRLHRRE